MTISVPEAGVDRDKLSPEQYRRVSKIAGDAAGLMIPESKSVMVRSRLARRMRALGIDDVSDYLDLIESGDAEELCEMIAVLTTNVTSFFREDHHFKTLSEDIAEGLLEKARAGNRVRIWSAGCSLGAEPISIAITLLEHSTAFLGSDTRILATDIDRHVLASAKSGEYTTELLRDLSPDFKRRHFRAGKGDKLAVSDEIRGMISYRELNLVGAWPMRGQFDVIFCRNVAIYFNDTTQLSIWSRFAQSLVPGGWLFVGHSERVPESIDLTPSGKTSYQKAPEAETLHELMRTAHVH